MGCSGSTQTDSYLLLLYYDYLKSTRATQKGRRHLSRSYQCTIDAGTGVKHFDIFDQGPVQGIYV